MKELFVAFLSQHDDDAWLRALERIERSIHPVDRAATRIWFHFYPLALQELMARPEAPDLARQMTLAGRWRLADNIDGSHTFLYGHQHWPVVRRLTLDFAQRPPGSLDLGAQVQELASRVAGAANTSPTEVMGISAVGLRTLQQVGPDALEGSHGTAAGPGLYRRRTAQQIVDARERGPRKGWLSMFGGTSRAAVVSFDERDPSARFPIVHSQHLTTAAALDTRDYRARDPRCSEGPIPVHCRSCSCGTCWVGILGGAEKLSPMDDRERSKLAECGVAHDPTAGGVIRLACMAEAEGPASIVIPPWNGLLGRVLTRTARGTQPSR